MANALQSVEEDPTGARIDRIDEKVNPLSKLASNIPVDTAAEGHIVEKTRDDDCGERAERIGSQALFQSK